MKSDQGQGISIVIPSWNNKAALLKCLRALEMQTALAVMEVIIADDGSEDGSAEEVGERDWKFPLKYLALRKIMSYKTNGFHTRILIPLKNN